jgi:hypothetical protein
MGQFNPMAYFGGLVEKAVQGAAEMFPSTVANAKAAANDPLVVGMAAVFSGFGCLN